MRHVPHMLVLAAATSVASTVAGAQQQVVPIAPPPPSVVAMGQSEIKVTPDRATVMVSVETRGKTAAAAGAENARITEGLARWCGKQMGPEETWAPFASHLAPRNLTKFSAAGSVSSMTRPTIGTNG